MAHEKALNDEGKMQEMDYEKYRGDETDADQAYGAHKNGPPGGSGSTASLADVFSLHNGETGEDKLPVLSSTKQIIEVAQSQVKERVWSARELLTWKIPEQMSSTGCNLRRSRVEAEFLPPPISLYKFNLVTQRIKEQLVNFCGIVTHVK